jgi:hypothetical protein
MLTPMTQQLLEKVFSAQRVSPGASERSLSGLFVFHRELGLLLQNSDSRRIMPKAQMALSWDSFQTSLESLLIPKDRPALRGLWNQEGFSAMGLFELLPGRIEEADTLFFWTGSWPWGRVVFLKVRAGRDGGEHLYEQYRNLLPTLDPILEPFMESWMLDSTLEVFWSRILVNMPPEYQPVPGALSPDWFRTVTVRVEGVSEEGKILCGHYYHEPGRGWARSVDRLEKKDGDPVNEDGQGKPKIPTRTANSKGAVDIPLDLWGIFDLGTVRIPSGLIRLVGFSEFFSRLRRSKIMAMRSLYGHLLYSGKLDLLKDWMPDVECFNVRMLERIGQWLGEGIMNDPLVPVTLDSMGSKRGIEDRLRPSDLVLAEENRSDRLYLLLRHCPKEKVNDSVIPRLLKIEGLNERQFAVPLSLREYLAKDHHEGSGSAG